MARFLARTLTLVRPSALRSSHRPLRSLSSKVEFIEIDLSEDGPSPSSGAEGGSTAEAAGMRRLEDAIHGVIVRRSAPDWLPFVPGASYWVPQMRRPLGITDLMGTVAYTAMGAGNAEVMTEEEMMCLTTMRGWPSAAYFVEGKSPHLVKRSRKVATHTDDEES
ncbi:hypothetical protein GUJ93_ZPchr0004g39929 [Zizania palustris]|uniref:Uncharacterized protein n=1 Tax=Zizania palustris TaxID=103762 RepID=A0A8J5T115_ZIZPA|nr:hypothetical protein GUJ93_ZPchr0004g39929 [Zizania palustris]